MNKPSESTTGPAMPLPSTDSVVRELAARWHRRQADVVRMAGRGSRVDYLRGLMEGTLQSIGVILGIPAETVRLALEDGSL